MGHVPQEERPSHIEVRWRPKTASNPIKIYQNDILRQTRPASRLVHAQERQNHKNASQNHILPQNFDRRVEAQNDEVGSGSQDAHVELFEMQPSFSCHAVEKRRRILVCEMSFTSIFV